MSEKASEKTSTGDGRKLHIDASLIRSSSSTLPDELKELGVCAYNENDFQKGVLYQVDMQLAEYDLEQAEAKQKKSMQKKRPSSGLDEDEESCVEETYEEKRARLESTLETYSSYLDKDDESNSMPGGEVNETERMIQMGEMTPFGGSILKFNIFYLRQTSIKCALVFLSFRS